MTREQAVAAANAAREAKEVPAEARFASAERQYIELATSVANGHGAEAWFPGYGASLFRTTWSFTGPLSGLYEVLGPAGCSASCWQ